MYTIEDLSNKKVALLNDGTLEELREVLSLAFPKDKHIASGDCKYYYTLDFNINEYNGTDKIPKLQIQSVKDFIKQIRDKEMEEQEYDLVDFKIEDLKEGETLVHEDSEFKIEGFVGNICFLNSEGVIIADTRELLKNKEFKLKVPKPKLEKIQGFEVREYPELPLVVVSDYPDFRVYAIENLVCVDRKITTNFFRCSKNNYKYCCPVPKDKRNFIDIED